MKDRTEGAPSIACRAVRRQLPALLALEDKVDNPRVVPIDRGLAGSELFHIQQHLRQCAACATEHRILQLSRTTLDLAASPVDVVPGEDFFGAVRARIRRGSRELGSPDESWSAALLMTARQLIPAMAILLLLIIGATFAWRHVPPPNATGPQASSQVPRLFEDPAPSPDDALDTLMAVEEKNNGK